MDASALDAVPEASREIPVEKASRGVGLSSGVIFVISVVIQLIGYVSTYFLTHSIGGNDAGKALLGVVQFSLLVASSINGIGDLRIGAAYTFFISRGKPPEASTATYLILRFAMVAVAGLALWFALAPSLQGKDPRISLGTIELTLAIFLTLPLLWSVSTVFTQLTVAQGESIRGQYPLLLESVVRTALLVYVAKYSPTVLAITLAYVPGAVASALYASPRVARYFRSFRRPEARELFRFAWPLMGSLMLMYVAGNAVSFLVVALAPNGTASLTLFNSANGFRILLLGVPAAVIVPLFPSLTSLHARGLIHRLRAQTWNALRFTAMAVVPGALCLTVYRIPFLNVIYVATFAPAAPALAVLAISSIPAALAMVIGTALNSVRLQRLELYLTSIQVAVLFGVAALLLPPVHALAGLGVDALMAAALATLASSVAALLVNTYFMERYMQVRIGARPLLTITLAAAVAFGSVALLNRVIDPSRWYTLLALVLLAFVVYYVALALTGELSKEDVRQLGGMIFLPPRAIEAFTAICWRNTTAYTEVLERVDDLPRLR